MSQDAITPEQIALLEDVRKEIKSEINHAYDTEFNLFRWVKGKSDDVLPSLRRHLKIRKVFHLDEYDKIDQDETIAKYAPVGLLGDSGKDPSKLVVIEYAGRVDIGGIVKCTQSTRYLSTRYKFLETVLKRMNEIEKKLNQQSYLIYIVDLEGMPFDPSLLGIVTGAYRILWEHIGENYPEMIAQVLVVNAPSFMSILWSALGPLLPEGSREKIIIGDENWRTTLLDYIDADHLPVDYGGTMTDANGDTMCRAILNFPPKDFDYKIPRELYWKPEEWGLKIEDLTDYTVGAGSQLYLSHYVLDEGGMLRMNVYGEEEFTMGLYYSDDPKSKQIQQWTEVYPSGEYPGIATINVQDFPCNKSGAYHVKFGNEKAWFRSIYLKILLQFLDKDGNPVKAIALKDN